MSPRGILAAAFAQRYDLVPFWELESVDGHDFQNVTAVSVDPITGILAVAVHVHAAVVLLDSRGRRIASWTGRLPVALHWQGDRVSILDHVKRTVITLDRNGASLGETAIDSTLLPILKSGFLFLRRPDIVGVVEDDQAYNSEQGTFHVLIGAIGSGRVDTIGIQTPSNPRMRTTKPVRPVAVPVGSGNIIVAENRDDTVRIFGRTGELVAAVCVETADDESRASALPGRAISGRYDRPPPAIRRIMVGADDRLWLQRTSTASWLLLDQYFGSQGATYDVLESDGRYMGVVTAPANARLAAGHGDTVFALMTHDGGHVSLAAFRIVPGMGPDQRRAH